MIYLRERGREGESERESRVGIEQGLLVFALLLARQRRHTHNPVIRTSQCDLRTAHHHLRLGVKVHAPALPAGEQHLIRAARDLV